MGDGRMSERFSESKFAPVEVNGELIHPHLTIHVQPNDEIQVHWESATPERSQGLALRLRKPDVPGAKGRGGMLSDGRQQAPSWRFWQDDPSGDKSLVVTKLLPTAILRVSNVWIDPSGRIDEWWNHYGMSLTSSEDGLRHRLVCSDGFEAFTLGDLIATITVVRSAN